MLDDITINKYPDRIAAVEIHARMWMDTLCYNAEAYQRWQNFPGDNNPSRLYLDGHRDPSYYWTWEDSIVARMNKPATVNIRLTGSFTPASGSGSITGIYRNDSSATLTGRLMFVITEDSVYYMDSLGGQRKEWHNHTPRDYLPGPLGAVFTVLPGDSVSYTRPFNISLPVRYQYCSIVTYFQDTVLRPDTVTRIMYQGGRIRVADLIGIGEGETGDRLDVQYDAAPNPCAGWTKIAFDLPAGEKYRIRIFDCAGRRIADYQGFGRHGREIFTWRCADRQGVHVSAGVYFYRLRCGSGEKTGTIVVR